MSGFLTDVQKNQFFEDGYIILKDFFTDESLTKLETSLVRFYAVQAFKILEYRKKLSHGSNILEYSTADDLVEILEMMEDSDKEALYQVQKLFLDSHFIKEFFSNKKLINVSSDLLKTPEELILISDLGLFVNKPQTERLLYKWHNESHFYPKRQNFLNVWFPMFFDKNLENGTMMMAKKSHTLKDLPFIEYSGYDKDSLGKKNYFKQLEVPESYVDEFEKIPMLCKRGDVVLFNRNLVHASKLNHSDNYSFAGVTRIWEPTQDLTLSGTFGVQPYGNDFGRPGIDKINLS
jgi:ectoine hydroxylase-related dioxygenase (phytanoyl-CoA dioxygenase family)